MAQSSYQQYYQNFGQTAQGYWNYLNAQGNNHGQQHHGQYGPLSTQGQTGYSPQTPPPQYYNSPSQPYQSNEPSPLLGQKPGYTSSYIPLAYSEPTGGSVNRGKIRRFTKFRRWLDLVLTISSCLTAILSALMQAAMLYMLIIFQKTRNIHGGARDSPWAKGTRLWPTIMLTATSGVTLILSIWGLALLIRDRRRKAKANRLSSNPGPNNAAGGPKKRKKSKTRRWVTVAKYVIHIGFWAGIVIYYRVAKISEKDLWGWSCSEKADAIQEIFKTDLNFEQLCHLQTHAWILSLSETGGKIIFSLVALILYRKSADSGLDLTDDFGEAFLDTPGL